MPPVSQTGYATGLASDDTEGARLTAAAAGRAIIPAPPRSTGRLASWDDRLPQLSLHTPIGDLTVSAEDGSIVAIDWGWGRDQTDTPLLRRARDQLHRYFDGESTLFDLPLAPRGTAYRQRVWAALLAIPPGTTRSYIDIARIAGGSARSVGGANGANPIPIVIPCHRVVATTGIGGYSGGDGLPTKRHLLQLEARASRGPPILTPHPNRTMHHP